MKKADKKFVLTEEQYRRFSELLRLEQGLKEAHNVHLEQLANQLGFLRQRKNECWAEIGVPAELGAPKYNYNFRTHKIEKLADK